MRLQWYNVSAKARQESPVFIVGPPRSGTSLVYRTLQLHTSFRLNEDPPRVDLTETQIFTHMYVASALQGGPASREFAYYLGDEREWRRLQEMLTGVIGYQRRMMNLVMPVETRLSRSRWLRSIWWKLNLNHHLLRVYFHSAKAARGVTRILEKTPEHAYHLKEIGCTFPHSKILFVVRHPVDVYASFRRRLKRDMDAGVDGGTLAWLRIGKEGFCDRYSEAVNIAFRERQSMPDRFMIVKYEDMVTDPGSTLESICGFLGEPFEPQCVRGELPALSRYRPGATPVDPLLEQSIAPNPHVWSEFVSPKDAGYIETSLAEQLQALEYADYVGP